MLDLPESAVEVVKRAKADVQRELQSANPFLKNSWLGAIVTAAANRIYDFYLQLNIAIRESFPDTATGAFLTRWAAIWGKQILPATKSTGTIVATGTVGSSIPAGTVVAVSGVGNYTSTVSATIAASTININDLTRSGATATATTASDHGLADGVSVTISGASNAEYNTTADITVTAANEFQYAITGSPPNEIGTSATAAFTIASVPVQSDEFGTAYNIDSGTQFRLQSPIIGVDDILVSNFDAIGGGSDQETESELRARMLDRIQNPVAHFNVAAITEKAKEVSGVTRVFVQEITPALGQVTIYFMRDNDVNPIPVGADVANVKSKILEIKPANTDDDDVIVNAPTGVPVDFTLSALAPNTTTMQTAISANLRQFFDSRTSVGVNIDEDAYRAAIFNTVDTVTGDTVQTFALSTPAGDVVIAAGEIGILGTVTYP